MNKFVILPCFLFICLTAKSQYNQEVTLKILLKTDTTSIGQHITYPDSASSEVSMVKVIIPPSKSTGWHKHHFPVFAYVLQGELTVELENGKSMIFKSESSFSEVINTMHNGKNNGKNDVVLIAMFIGEKGKPLSVH